MKRNLGILLSLCLLLPAAAQADGTLDQRIALRVTDADPQEVLATFGQMMGVPVDIDPEIQRPLSIQVEDVSIRTALNAVCESVSCNWHLEGGKVLKFRALPKASSAKSPSLDEPVDIKVTDADLRNFMGTVAQLLNGNLDMDPALKGKITLDIENQGLRAVLDAACAQAKCRWKLAEGTRPVLEVRPK